MEEVSMTDEQEAVETWEQKCARLRFEIDDEGVGIAVIFLGARAAAQFQKATGTVTVADPIADQPDGA
jgi:hypothetical protein